MSVLAALTSMWLTWGRPSSLVWNNTTDPCAWPGVSCTSSGDVTGLMANGRGLSHPLDPAVGALTSLTTLDLGDNRMPGLIPESLSVLVGLVDLNLGTNRLSGTIPAQLSTLTDLNSLYLDRCDLAGSVPAQLSTLTSITSLFLHGNMLTGTLPLSLSTIGHALLVQNNPALCGPTEGFATVGTVGTDLGRACPMLDAAVPQWVILVIAIAGSFAVGFVCACICACVCSCFWDRTSTGTRPYRPATTCQNRCWSPRDRDVVSHSISVSSSE